MPGIAGDCLTNWLGLKWFNFLGGFSPRRMPGTPHP